MMKWGLKRTRHAAVPGSPRASTALMTGGTALPTEVNPPPAPEAGDQPGGTGQPGVPGLPYDQPLDQQPAGKLPGLPRLFFAEHELDPHVPLQPGGGPASQGQPGSGWGQPAQPSQGPQARPGQRVGRQRRTKPPGRELRQRGFASLTFGVMSLIAIIFGFGPDPSRSIYVVIFSSLVGLTAVVVGVSAIVKARKTGSYRPRGVIGGIGLGALATVVSLLFGVLYLAYPNQMRTYVNCIDQAQSASQKQTCLNQLENSIKASLPRQGGPG